MERPLLAFLLWSNKKLSTFNSCQGLAKSGSRSIYRCIQIRIRIYIYTFESVFFFADPDSDKIRNGCGWIFRIYKSEKIKIK